MTSSTGLDNGGEHKPVASTSGASTGTPAQQRRSSTSATPALPTAATTAATPTSELRRLAALHPTIPSSYAYGAPSIGKPRPSASSQHGKSNSLTGASASPGPSASMGPLRDNDDNNNYGDHSRYSDDDDDMTASTQLLLDEQDPEAFTGRSREPAAVRYARMKQRRRDTGSPLLHGTGLANPRTGSTSKSTPLGQANGGRKPAGAAQSTPGIALQGTTVNIATAFAQAVAGKAPVGAGKYHQFEEHVASSRHGLQPWQLLERGLTESNEHDQATVEEDADSGKETHVPGGGADVPGSKKRKKRPNKDPSYKPMEGEGLSEEDDSVDASRAATVKRSKTVTATNESETLQASPRSGKKHSRRKPGDATYKPAAESDAATDEDSEEDSNRRRSKGKGRAQEPGAISIGQRDGEDWQSTARKRKARRSTAGQDQNVDDVFAQATAASGVNTIRANDDDFGGLHQIEHVYNDTLDSTDQHPATSFFLQAKSPGRPASVDPVFAAFDKSINDSSVIGPDFDDSGLRSSSYDYSEEERIVAALEQQKRLDQARSSTAATTSAKRSPAQSAQGGLRRRNKLPGPPGGLDEIVEESSGHDSLSSLAVGAKRLLNMIAGGMFKWTQDPLLDWFKLARAVAVTLLGLTCILFYLRSAPTTPSLPRHTPRVLPETLEEVVTRLTMLESTIDQLSSATRAEQSRHGSDRSEIRKLADELTHLEQDFARDRHAAKTAIESNDEAQRKAKATLEASIRATRTELDSTSKRSKDIGDNVRLHSNEIQRLQSGLDSLSKHVLKLDSSVSTLTNEVRSGIDGDRIAQIALDAIEARLPSKLVVQLDSAGKLRIDPTFWKYLRDAFAERSHVDKAIRSEVARLGSRGQTAAPVQTREPSWEEFLHANEVSLRSWIATEIDGRSGPDAVVSRRMFMDTLKKEIRVLKSDFEIKVNENVEQIGREILDKVAKQDEIKRKNNLGSNLNPFHHRPKSAGEASKITIESRDGQNVTAIINSLVDSALLRYSKDVLGRPDYALFSAGGRVIRSLTSPTYEPHPAGAARKALAWVTGTKAPRGLPPVVALQPGTTPGSCWPFAGQQGQLGIQLSRTIVPTDVTIEHTSVDVAVDGSVASAPREFEIWAVVEQEDDMRRLAQYRHQDLEAKRQARASGTETLDDKNELPTSVPPTPNHFLLAVGTYDVTNPSPIQTFPVTPAAQQLGIPVNVVIVRVLSNHGEKAYTCLYRVRVGGATPVKLKEERAE
ncbi:hypothetical protein OIO90_004870 [Microbotryomycetes sp. JL221]|nr:hypothetical protein OIO90_004870 [Microbotryomycetes sp. JL221]